MKRRKQRRGIATKGAPARGVARRHGRERPNPPLPVDVRRLAPTSSYSTPAFVEAGFYVDEPFFCAHCGRPQVWTPSQQKWWYETAKGGVFTAARLCRSCRAVERARRAKARAVHLEGLARKRSQRPAGPKPRP